MAERPSVIAALVETTDDTAAALEAALLEPTDNAAASAEDLETTGDAPAPAEVLETTGDAPDPAEVLLGDAVASAESIKKGRVRKKERKIAAKIVLKDYQKEARFMLKERLKEGYNQILHGDTGLGKTIIAIRAVKAISCMCIGKFKVCVVLPSQGGSLPAQWINKLYQDDVRNCHCFDKELLEPDATEKTHWTIITITKLWMEWKAHFAKEGPMKNYSSPLFSNGFDFIVFDEGHNFRNLVPVGGKELIDQEKQIGRSAMSFLESCKQRSEENLKRPWPFVLIISATVYFNKRMDVFSMTQLLNCKPAYDKAHWEMRHDPKVWIETRNDFVKKYVVSVNVVETEFNEKERVRRIERLRHMSEVETEEATTCYSDLYAKCDKIEKVLAALENQPFNRQLQKDKKISMDAMLACLTRARRGQEHPAFYDRPVFICSLCDGYVNTVGLQDLITRESDKTFKLCVCPCKIHKDIDGNPVPVQSCSLTSKPKKQLSDLEQKFLDEASNQNSWSKEEIDAKRTELLRREECTHKMEWMTKFKKKLPTTQKRFEDFPVEVCTKLCDFIKFLQEEENQGQRIIMWSSWVEVIKEYHRILKVKFPDRKFYVLSGSFKVGELQDFLDDTENDGKKVLLASRECAGTGLDMAAQTVVFKHDPRAEDPRTGTTFGVTQYFLGSQTAWAQEKQCAGRCLRFPVQPCVNFWMIHHVRMVAFPNKPEKTHIEFLEWDDTKPKDTIDQALVKSMNFKKKESEGITDRAEKNTTQSSLENEDEEIFAAWSSKEETPEEYEASVQSDVLAASSIKNTTKCLKEMAANFFDERKRPVDDKGNIPEPLRKSAAQKEQERKAKEKLKETLKQEKKVKKEIVKQENPNMKRIKSELIRERGIIVKKERPEKKRKKPDDFSDAGADSLDLGPWFDSDSDAPPKRKRKRNSDDAPGQKKRNKFRRVAMSLLEEGTKDSMREDGASDQSS